MTCYFCTLLITPTKYLITISQAEFKDFGIKFWLFYFINKTPSRNRKITTIASKSNLKIENKKQFNNQRSLRPLPLDFMVLFQLSEKTIDENMARRLNILKKMQLCPLNANMYNVIIAIKEQQPFITIHVWKLVITIILCTKKIKHDCCEITLDW